MGWQEFLSTLAGSDTSAEDETEESNPDSNNDVGGKLFPDEFDKVIVDELPPGELSKVKKIEEEYVLVVDVAQADPEDWETAKTELREQFAEAGGISVETASPIVSAYRNEEGQQYIDKLCGFYEDKVPPRILTMIRESLVLRLATESGGLSYEEVRRRKRQIAKYGDEGFAIASLCSAGYFDEDRFFWNLYDEEFAGSRHPQKDYEETVLQLVRDLPFVIFVKHEDRPQDIYDEILRKSIQSSDYDPEIEFVDVRGMGRDNRNTIKRTKESIDEYHEDVGYDSFEKDQELVIRIDPNTL